MFHSVCILLNEFLMKLCISPVQSCCCCSWLSVFWENIYWKLSGIIKEPVPSWSSNKLKTQNRYVRWLFIHHMLWVQAVCIQTYARPSRKYMVFTLKWINVVAQNAYNHPPIIYSPTGINIVSTLFLNTIILNYSIKVRN